MNKFSSQDVPLSAGVYLFRNAAGEVIYVGKAKSLRKRLSSYFQPSRRVTADAKVRALIHSIASYELFTTKSENDALVLEDKLVKQFGPRYNVDLRDDKRYLLITFDPAETFPRLRLTRLVRPDGKRYFGPVPHARVLRDILRLLSERFGLRSCRARVITPETGRHCLGHAIRTCCGACLGRITPAEYAARLAQAIELLEGRNPEVLAELAERMQTLARERKYEEAARLRDILANIASLKAKRGRGPLVSYAADSAGLLGQMRTLLHLPRDPKTIECFDISNIGGRLAVGSMVCFRNGRPARSDYRRYRIQTVESADDFAMIGEVVRRRYLRLTAEGRPLPDLLMVDGGIGQLNAALASLREIQLPSLPVISLAKKLEEIYRPGTAAPVVLPRTDPVLKLLQALRDEAHRFALTYHLALRGRRLRESILDEIEGIGEQRRILLLRHFGSVRRLARASVAEIAAAAPGIGERLAAEMLAFLKTHTPGAKAPDRGQGAPAA